MRGLAESRARLQRDAAALIYYTAYPAATAYPDREVGRRWGGGGATRRSTTDESINKGRAFQEGMTL